MFVNDFDMNSENSDNCVVCSKTVKKCHKEISCKICSGFTHKKCTKLKSKQFKCLNVKEWVCPNCCQDVQTSSSDLENEVNNLNKSFDFHLTDVDFQKYDKMLFNPLRFEHNTTSKAYNDVTCADNIHKCSYLTPEQFRADRNEISRKNNFLNVNIRSLSKNSDSLRECIKSLDCKFDVIGISETHLKDKPNDLLRIDGFNIEYTNRIGREKGGVCMYISEELKYKLRTDLCQANPNYESCFIEIENKNKNVIVGVVYRAHTPIDSFMKDIEPIYRKINSENKHVYIMGDFNIDLLKTDVHRPIHDYVDFIYSFSMLPSIYKPTRITATTATCIDNILTNNENIITPTILVNDTSDHMPTILSTNLDFISLKKQN